MADNILNIKVKFGSSEAVKGTQEVSNSINKMSNNVANANKKIISNNTEVNKSFDALSASVKGVFAMYVVNKIVDYLNDTVDAAKKAQASFTAFSSIVTAKSISMTDAMKAVNKISREGAISVSETQQAMQNLLQRGYSVSQAEEALEVLRNSAAFGKAAHLEFGEAIVSATEGLRQENSILVDNGGITKNVAKMWEEYAKSIGVTTESLSQNQKIEAELIGMRAEALVHMGNYEKMLSTVAGKEAQYNSEILKTKEIIGKQLIPAYSKMIEVKSEALKVTGFLISEFKKMGLSSIVQKDINNLEQQYRKGNISADEYHKKMVQLRKNALKELDKINEETSGASSLDPTGSKEAEAKAAKAKALAEKEAEEQKRLANRTAEQIWKDDAEANDKAMANAVENDKKLEKLRISQMENEIEILKNEQTSLETSLEKKLISYNEYASKVKTILASIDQKDGEVTAYKVTQLENKRGIPGLTEEQGNEVDGEITKLKQTRLNNGLKNAKDINNINSFGGGSKSQSTTYKETYRSQILSNEAQAFRNANKNEIQLNQEKLDDFLISYEEFYSNKEDLVKKSFEYELSLLNKQKADAQNSKPANEQERFEKLTEIAKITGEINNLENDKLNALKEINREQDKHNKLKEQTKALMENELNQARALAGVDVEQSKASTASSLGLISYEQMIQAEQYFADQRYEIQKDLLEKNMALYDKGSSEYESYLSSLGLLDVDYAKQKQENSIAMQASQLEQTMNMIKIYEDGFVDIAQSMTKGPEAVVDAFKRMGNAIMMELIAIEAKILARKVLSQLFGISLDGNQAQPGGMLGIANMGRANNPTGLAQGLLGGILGGGGTTNNNGANTTNNNNVTQNINISGGLGGGSDKSTLSQIFNGIGGAIKGAFGSIG